MAGRWAGLLCCLFMFLATLAALADTEALPDLALRGAVVEPSRVSRGIPVVVSFELIATIAPELMETVDVELACRRTDLETDCLVERRTVQLTGETAQAESFGIDTSEFPVGTYDVYLRVDPDDVIAEANETNNRVIAHLTVTNPLPDLVPTALTVDPRSPIEAGSTVRFSASIDNTGATPAGRFVVVCEIVTGSGSWTSVGSVLVAGLERDDTVAVHFPHTVTEVGTHGLRVRVDSAGAVPERDEANNQLATSFTVVVNEQQKPELRPISLTLSPGSPLGWLENATARVEVINSGGASTTAGVQVAFHYRRVGTSDPAWQELKDPQELKDEQRPACDPSNWKWAIRPKEAEPLSIEIGRNTRVFLVPIDFAEQEREANCDGQVIAPRILPGEYELVVTVDPENAVAEQDEDNNELIIGFSIVGSELQPESLELSQAVVARGTDIVVRASIRNTGAKAAEVFTVAFFADAKRLDTYYYNGQGLATGDVVTVQGVIETQDLVEGDHLVRVVVDPDDQVFEHDEANNAISAPFKVADLFVRKAELVVDQIRFEPATPIPPGRPFAVSAAISNEGDLTAEAFDVVLRLARTADTSAAPVGDEESADLELPKRVMRLEPRQSVWLEWTSPGMEEGTYYATVEIDPATDPAPASSGQIPERDEENNFMAMRFAVSDLGDIGTPPPAGVNLACYDLRVSPDVVAPGAQLTIVATVANGGLESASACNLELSWMYPTGYTREVETRRIAPLAAGVSTEFTATVDTSSFPSGVHQAILRVDADAEVEETSEDDNACFAAVQVGTIGGGGRPDLAPTSVRFDSPGSAVGENNTVELNQRLYVHVTIRNDGNIPSGPFHVAFETPLGVETEAWTSIGALDQVEVSHPMPTGEPGTFPLLVTVDPDGRVPEEDDANNTIAATYAVQQVPPRIERVVPPTGASARWLARGESGDRVFAVWTDGHVRSIDANGEVTDVAFIGETVSCIAWMLGATPYMYAGTAGGTVFRVDLETGSVSGRASLGDSVVAIAPGSGKVYAAVQDGFYEIIPSGLDYAVSRQVEVSGLVRDIRYDTDRSTIYVLSSTGIHACGLDLARVCFLEADQLVGAPACFALAGTGIYVGTSAGSGAVVYALSHCTLTAPGSGHILSGWRYPQAGSAPGQITSIVVDPRDIDPIYVATDTGSLYSLGFDGTPYWVYQADSAITSTPLVDERTGRIFFGDGGGFPHVLTLDGIDAFSLDLAGYRAAAIRSTLVIAETRERTDFGTRLVRHYYYGTEDGAVYRVSSQQ